MDLNRNDLRYENDNDIELFTNIVTKLLKRVYSSASIVREAVCLYTSTLYVEVSRWLSINHNMFENSNNYIPSDVVAGLKEFYSQLQILY